jgi:RND family efflux transporter MFP subunit
MNIVMKRVVVPGGITFVAAGVAAAMISRKPKAERVQAEKQAVVVRVQELNPETTAARVMATGTAEAARVVTLMPQVSGRVTWVSDKLVPGGFVASGERLAQIDPSDYRLAIEQEKSRVRRAELELELENGRGEVAMREWKLLGGNRAPSEAPLAVRSSQRKVAELEVEAAKSGLRRAELNLARTTLRAPFNATVTSENVDVGQVIGQQTQVARLVGTDEVWVAVSLPLEEVQAIDVPGLNADQGSRTVIRQRLPGRRDLVREGRVLRMVSELDSQTRRAQLLISVLDPFDLKGGLPLLPGAFVDVEIIGRDMIDVYEVPRTVLYQGRNIWLVSNDSTLVPAEVSVKWRAPESVFVTTDIEPGARVVTSVMPSPIAGTLVHSEQALTLNTGNHKVKVDDHE